MSTLRSTNNIFNNWNTGMYSTAIGSTALTSTTFGSYPFTSYTSPRISASSVITVFKFKFKNNDYNMMLNNRYPTISEDIMIFKMEYKNERIEPLDTIFLLLNEFSDLEITKQYDNKILNTIILKNFRFVSITNLLSYTSVLNVSFKYDTFIYDNPNIPLKEKRNIKIKNILK